MEHTPIERNLNTASLAPLASLTPLSGSDTEEVATEYEVTSQATATATADSDDDLPPLVEDTEDADEDFQWNYLQMETNELKEIQLIAYRELHRRLFKELLTKYVPQTRENQEQPEEHSEDEDTEHEDTEHEDTENEDTENEDTEHEDTENEASHQESDSDSDSDLPRIVRRNEGPPTALVFFTLIFVLLHVIQLAFLLQEKRERDAHPCFRVYRP